MLFCGFFKFGLFQIQVKKIVFKTQNFVTSLGLIFGSGKFSPGPHMLKNLRDVWFAILLILVWEWNHSHVD